MFKTDGKSSTIGSNVKVSSWLPQNDVLGHLKTRPFIGHAGMNGILEAAYHGVPMICVPFSGDQFDNAVARQSILGWQRLWITRRLLKRVLSMLLILFQTTRGKRTHVIREFLPLNWTACVVFH